MTALERILQLKKEGKSEKEIISILRSEKYSPLKIEDALNQSKIKEAVTDPNPTEGMNASIMNSNNEQNEMEQKEEPKEEENFYSPRAPEPQEAPTPPQEPYSQQNPYAQQAYPDNQASQAPFGQFEQENYPSDYDENYDDYSTADPSYASSTDAIIEVSEQVFSEKIRPLTKNIKDLLEFKKITEAKLIDFNERLKRMEKNFDKMQLSILDKVSEYGKGLDYLRKEVKMVEDSVSKFSQN